MVVVEIRLPFGSTYPEIPKGLFCADPEIGITEHGHPGPIFFDFTLFFAFVTPPSIAAAMLSKQDILASIRTSRKTGDSETLIRVHGSINKA